MNPFSALSSSRKADVPIEEKEIKRTRLDLVSEGDGKKNIHIKRPYSSSEAVAEAPELALEIIEKNPHKLLRDVPEKLSLEQLVSDFGSLGIRKRTASFKEENREFKIITLEEKNSSLPVEVRSNKRKESTALVPICPKVNRSEEKDRYAKFKRKDETNTLEHIRKESKLISSPKAVEIGESLEYFEKYVNGCPAPSKTAPFVEISENILLPKEESIEGKSLALFGTTVAHTSNNACLIRDISNKKSKFDEVYSGVSLLQSIEWLNSKQILAVEVSPPRILVIDIIAKEAIKQFLPSVKSESKLSIIARLNNTEFLTGDTRGAVHLVNVTTNTIKRCVEPNDDAITSIVPSIGGPRVAIGFQSGRIRVYDSIIWQDAVDSIWPHKAPIKSLAWFPRSNNTLLAAGGEEGGELFVYDLAKKEKLLSHQKVDKLITNVIFIDAPSPEFVITRGSSSKIFKGPELEFYQFSKGKLQKTASVAANTSPRSIFSAVYSKSCSALILRTQPLKEKEAVIAILNIKRPAEVVSSPKKIQGEGKGRLFGDYIR